MEEKRWESKENKKGIKLPIKVIIIGVITLVVSFIILELGFFGFGNAFTTVMSDSSTPNQITNGAFGGMGLLALGGIINPIGFLLTFAGGIVLFIAHRREITAYGVQQVMPVAKEGIEKITPTVANAAGSIAESISKGIESTKKNAGNK